MALTTAPQRTETFGKTATRRLVELLTALIDWRMWLLMLGCAVLMLLAIQQPFRYYFQVGIDRGADTDLPFVRGFFGPELVTWDNSWRWSIGDSGVITVPGIGERPVGVNLKILSHRGQWQPEAGTPTLTFDAGAGPLTFELRPQAARYHFYVPASALDNGTLRMRLISEPWINPADARQPLGVAVGEDLFVDGLGGGAISPDWLLLLCWPLGVGLLWLAARAGGLGPWQASAVMIGPALIVPFATLFEAPRLAFGSIWAVQAGLITLASALVFAAVVPWTLQRFDAPIAAKLLPWLVLLLSGSFYLKYAGQWYPESMPGDLQLHINRFTRTALGELYFRAQHRGLPFPFPNAPYLMIAPLTLSGIPLPRLYEFTAAVFESLAVLVVYLTVSRLSANARIGFFAALTYTLVAVGHMNTWFSFQTQVATQFYSVLLLAVLTLGWPDYRGWTRWGLAGLLFVMVFLGHIGSFINTAVLGLLIVPVLWWRARGPEQRQGALKLLWFGVFAAAFAGIFYYTAFWDLVVTQVSGVFTEGLNGVTERDPIPRSDTLHALWYEGMILHYGFFPIVLAIAGAWMISRDQRYRDHLLPPLIWLTFLAALSQGILPLITLSSITTRWLTFAGWAICVASAFAFEAIWRRGWFARLGVIGMYCFVFWQTAIVWAEAMFLRGPPPEPF
ncbi:MAG: hypothetical protein HC822_24675 [Oscillochloris sp.]|nr:hypothetical protein [Oscillochloris sp.]